MFAAGDRAPGSGGAEKEQTAREERSQQCDDLEQATQIRNLTGLYGSLQGIAGGALHPVAALEAPVDDDDQPEILALVS